MKLKFLSIVSLCLIFACSPVKFVKPLPKKQNAANLSMGGALIEFGNATIPLPFITATYGRGFDSTLTGFASLNLTSALFGNAHLELGVTKQVLKQDHYIPAVSITPVVNIIYRNKDARKLYPQVAVNAFWEYGKRKNLIYVGVDNWFELSSKRAYNIEQPNRWIFMPTAGHTFTGKKWNFNIETKIIAPNLSNERLVVEYQTPLNTKGAFGVYFGCVRKF